jgi:hypothetical protein
VESRLILTASFGTALWIILPLRNSFPPRWLEECVFAVGFYEVAVIERIKIVGVYVKSLAFGAGASWAVPSRDPSQRFVALMTFGLRCCYAEVSHGLEVMKGLRLALCVLPLLSGGVAFADSISSSTVRLQVGQSIRAADASLLASGWLPQPDQTIEGPEQDNPSGPALPALSACSGTGVGFCRYDYARDRQRLSVVTVPSPSADVSGLVQRWWID